jgi:Uma2 family endonuclease
MIAGGILTENDRVQLVDGVLVPMPPIGPTHSYVVGEAARILSSLVGAGWHVRTQQPVSLATSEPEPDVAVVRGASALFRQRHPSGSDLALVIEVADTTLRLDRGDKLPVYAAAGIPEYWIVNLESRQVEVHREPVVPHGGAMGDYRFRQLVPHDGVLRLTVDGQTLDDVPVADLLP